MYSYAAAHRRGQIDTPGVIHEAKRIGADGVELLEYFYQDVEAESPSVLRALRETGLPCPIFSVSNNFAKLTSEEREVQLRRIKFGVDQAILHGADTVRIFAGDVAEGITFDQAREWIVKGLATASTYAQSRGIKLALENHGTLAGRGDQVLGLINDVRSITGYEGFGANPDTGNFILVNQSSHEAIQQVASMANMVHFKDFKLAWEGYSGYAYTALDGRKYAGMVVGEGEVNLGECIQALKDAGFDGWLSVEYEGEEDPFTAVPRCVENARRFL